MKVRDAYKLGKTLGTGGAMCAVHHINIVHDSMRPPLAKALLCPGRAYDGPGVAVLSAWPVAWSSLGTTELARCQWHSAGTHEEPATTSPCYACCMRW